MDNSKLNLVLADDHSVVSNGIKMLLQTKKQLDILSICKNGLEVVDLVKDGNRIDILVTDINMPEMDGLELIRQLKTLSPNTKVIVLTMLDEFRYVRAAFEEGVYAYLIKNADVDELFFALDRIIDNKKYCSSELTVQLLMSLLQNAKSEPSNPPENFTDREMEILSCIADGMTNNEMSEKLFLSKRTVEGHRQSLLEKTNSRNTATLIRYAVRNGLID